MISWKVWGFDRSETGGGDMKNNVKDVQDLSVAYIGGGSRGWAWGFMKDLAMDGEICGTLRLYDIDREAAERNRVIGEKISEIGRAHV